MNSYEFWSAKRDKIQEKLSCLPHEDLSVNLRENYRRQIDIFDDILNEAVMVLDDDQYEETTSWEYESELKELYKNQTELEDIFEKKYELFQHEKMLKELGWTEEQYQKNQSELYKKKRKKTN